MKLLTSSYSSSSSPSSSSTLSLDPTLCNSKIGCLTSILHRILCSGAIPTHPSDQIRELDSMPMVGSVKLQEFNPKHNTEATSTNTPGLVARLMGLDSMGETIPFEKTTPNSLSRSKSMNYVDHLGECKRMENQHKRVKSFSSSFHEVPTFHLLENENFFVLSFESEEEFKFRGRKKGKGSAELKQRKEERVELKKNKREKVDYEENLRTKVFDKSCEKECKEINSGEKVKRRKKRTICNAEKKVEEAECSSEDSSPVSVFDFERPGVDSFSVDFSWRRKLSPELENDQHFILHSASNLMVEEREVKATEDNKKVGLKKKEKQVQDCVDIWGEICRLVGDELVSNQLQEGKRKQGDFESVIADFESAIFDQLLNEVVDQLIGSPLKALQLQNL